MREDTVSERRFTVIKGGGDPHGTPKGGRFHSGYVTDTRLMGVLGLYIRWKIEPRDGCTDFHQFFYFDAEEYGLDTYRSVLGNDESALQLIEDNLIGGLGAVKVPVNEREAIHLVQSFAAAGKALKVPLPEPVSEYSFLLQKPVELSDSEQRALAAKVCTRIRSEYQLIHYFLMRCFALDQEGASYLVREPFDCKSIGEKDPSTLCRNSVEEFRDEGGALSYLCEALVELDNKYTLVVLEVTVAGGRIVSAQRRSSFRVSAAEASMLLNRPEFVTVYEILTDPDDFDDRFLPMTTRHMVTSHEIGRLFLEFNSTNDHVDKKVFLLNEDIHGMFFVTDFGQLLIAAYSPESILALERNLQAPGLRQVLSLTAKYEFKEPVLYEFINSEYDDFNEFLQSLQ